MSKKSRFREPFDMQHGKWGETLLKFDKARLPYLLISVKAIQVGKVSLIDM